MANNEYHDCIGRLAQAGGDGGVRLVRIASLAGGNRYVAEAVEFASDGSTQLAEDAELEVVNLAEPADGDGQLAAGTEAVAVDVEGRWVIFVRPAVSAAFAARVISSQGGGVYTIREQEVDEEGGLSDKAGAADVAARNLAEASLGPGAAMDDDTIVIVTTLTGAGSPPQLLYVFDHPTYAKYLD